VQAVLIGTVVVVVVVVGGMLVVVGANVVDVVLLVLVVVVEPDAHGQLGKFEGGFPTATLRQIRASVAETGAIPLSKQMH
jgi:hypothetical protein